MTPLTVVAFAWHTVKSGVDQGILSRIGRRFDCLSLCTGAGHAAGSVDGLGAAAGEQIVLKGGTRSNGRARQGPCLDKTGTLTTGRPRVVEFVVDDPGREWEILAAASAVARSSITFSQLPSPTLPTGVRARE